MQELQPPCTGAIEEKNSDGTFRVKDPNYAGQLFTGVLVTLDQSITITHVVIEGDKPWLVRHYVLDVNRPMHRDM
jgi:Tfp pilus assembly protein PilP